MERILSQEEISELLSAVNHGDLPAEPEGVGVATPHAISRLDLVRAHSGGDIHLQNLDLILDSFARNYSITLTNRIQQPATVKRSSITSMECESFLQRLKNGVAIGLFKLEPLRHGVLIVFEPELSFAMVEIQLGGGLKEAAKIQNRALTAIEINILNGVFADVSLDLAKALGDLANISISLQGIQNNPRMVSLIPTDAMTVVTQLDIEINGVQGRMHLVIPNSIIEALREKLQKTEQPDQQGNDKWRRQILNELPMIPLGMSAELGTISLEMRDFINFQVGDIIDLPWNPSEPLTIQVEGRPKYFAQPGVRNGNKAVRIAGPYQEGAEHGKHS